MRSQTEHAHQIADIMKEKRIEASIQIQADLAESTPTTLENSKPKKKKKKKAKQHLQEGETGPDESQMI